jgi:N-hydroxyarylamine O-acetyltransferase
MNSGEVAQYLNRINYSGPVHPAIATLSELQKQHLLTVPFENLDIHNKTRIDLNNLFDKIVIRKRGGFCYELNGLFYDLLKKLGFTVKMVSARVYMDDSFSPEFDHMALIVTIEEENYLVDVGFGEFSFHPVKIKLNSESVDPRGIFKLEAPDASIVVKKKNEAGDFIPEYSFSEMEREPEEFAERCNYHQTNPASHFMQNRICSLPTLHGRISLSGNKLKITENGSVTEQILNNENEVHQVLKDRFGINF